MERKERTVVHFSFEVDTSYPRRFRIRAGKEDIACRVFTVFAQEEHILQISIESFSGQVHFPFPKLTIPIGTQRRAMRVLGFEVRIQTYQGHIAAHRRDMQVLIVSLRSPVTAAVTGAEHQALDRRITECCTRIDHHVLQHIMLLQTGSDEHRPILLFPFILGIHTRYMHILRDVAVIAHHAVVQTVVRIFRPYRQIAFRPTTRIRETVLQASDRCHVGTASIGRRVPTCSEITLTTDMLQRRIGRYEMFVIRREPIEGQLPGIDVMA